MNATDIHPLVISGYGLVEAGFDRAADRFGSHKRADQSEMSVVGVTTDPQEALGYLSVRTVPATRLVLVEQRGWTAVLTNHLNGSDFADHQFWASRSLAVPSIRVVDSAARWWKRDRLRERLAYEARIFEWHAADDSTIRSIACADDGGRWVFETSGDLLPIEGSFAYNAPRKKDRFTRENLHTLISEVGPGPLAGQTFLHASRFALLFERIADRAYRDRVEAAACTLEEADEPAFGYFRRGMGWVPHMATHATSVIADFERAVAFDPSYEPRVRDYLRAAHKVIGG